MYEKLVKRLRSATTLPAMNALCQEAADAVEELVRKEKFHAFLWNTIQPNEMEQYLAMYRAQAVPSELPKENEDA